LFSPLRQARQ
jgi:hypothetical protein